MTKKINLWDNQLLTDAYVKAIQLHSNIDNLVAHLLESPLGELPHSMVPTKLLYELVICNKYMYELLLEKELLTAGCKKQTLDKVH
jgi:hypothetical protein